MHRLSALKSIYTSFSRSSRSNRTRSSSFLNPGATMVSTRSSTTRSRTVVTTTTTTVAATTTKATTIAVSAATQSSSSSPRDSEADESVEEPPAKRRRVAATKTKADAKPKRSKKGAEVLDESALPKRVETPWKVGAHVSAAGGIHNAVTNAVKIGYVTFPRCCCDCLRCTMLNVFSHLARTPSPSSSNPNANGPLLRSNQRP